MIFMGLVSFDYNKELYKGAAFPQCHGKLTKMLLGYSGLVVMTICLWSYAWP